MSTEAHFFGYGSLVNAATHDYRISPARLTGWHRVWRLTALRPHAFLSAEPAEGETILGAIAPVPGADWRILDLREAAYLRHDVTASIRCRGRHGPCAVYSVDPRHLVAGPPPPILMSYLETVAMGFEALYGAEGLADLFERSSGWGGRLLDDRSRPLYSRATTPGAALRQEIEDRLTRLGLVLASA